MFMIRLQKKIKTYDTTFSIYYPPEIDLKGDFSLTDGKTIEIKSLNIHTNAIEKYDKSMIQFGLYSL